MIPGMMKYFYWVSMSLTLLSLGLTIQMLITRDFIAAAIAGSLFVCFMVTYIAIQFFNTFINVAFLIYNVLLLSL
jgi:hypothetical protein